ncbi:MAG: protein phosphatase, partial [Actinobacteria bacterium]|nr:protein phosphatase [Actinomycetota bacterium]
MQLRYAARSDVGLVRQGNEDSGYAGPHLLVVADGMGGHAAGELASATAIAILAELDANPPTDPVTSLTEAVDRIGETIVSLVQEDEEVQGMGTTVTGIYWTGDRLAIVHVGDSRAYMLRNGELSQLTHDHTYV